MSISLPCEKTESGIKLWLKSRFGIAKWNWLLILTPIISKIRIHKFVAHGMSIQSVIYFWIDPSVISVQVQSHLACHVGPTFKAKSTVLNINLYEF